MGRILAIDLGEKRVGLSVSDPTYTIAQPLKTIQFKSIKKLIEELMQIIESMEIERIVIGLPITMKGTYSKKTNEVLETVNKLESVIKIPIQMFDERRTTIQAQHTIRLSGKKPSENRDKIDMIAASHLLQNFLDLISNAKKMNN
jgi:putative Holliday junction resolvase